jgi:hypothetical protein
MVVAAMASGLPGLLVLMMVVVVALSSLRCCDAEIKQLSIADDSRRFILFETFGFESGGVVNIRLSHIQLPEGDDGERAGFFLSRNDDLVPAYANLQQEQTDCLLEETPQIVTKLFTLATAVSNSSSQANSTGALFVFQFTVPVAEEYSLYFENCLKQRVSFDVTTSMYNLEKGFKDYLPVGQTQLPTLFFAFFLAHLVLLGIWSYVCWKQKLSLHRIHIVMAVPVVMKALNLICEAEDERYVKRMGTPHGLTVASCFFNLLREGLFSSVGFLMGAGLSLLKPHLQDKEKKVLMVVIPLQILANGAFMIYDVTGPSTKDFFAWEQVFLLVDIICCCAVLFPIDWSIRHLRDASPTDGKAAQNLMKLTLFRHYYIVVVSYIYFTRLVVFGLLTVTVYRYRWTSNFAEEMAALAFFMYTGYKFRPVERNPYLVLEDDEEEAAAIAALEALDDDEFDL